MENYQLAFHSQALKSNSDQDILDILLESSRFNQQHKLNGLLIFNQGYFFGVLEGNKAAVLSIIRKIEHDPRHLDFVISHQKSSKKTYFTRWNMICHTEDLNCLPLQAKQFQHFLSECDIKPSNIDFPAELRSTLHQLYRQNAHKNYTHF